jgi:hypothetical protein
MQYWRRNPEETFGVLASGKREDHMSQADEFRKQAAESRKRANEAKSLGQGARDRRRAEGLEQLAANEDWLDGKPKAKE